MYFTNISDTELTQYHNQVEAHFTRTLKTIIDETEPNLFKIEEITDDILKIYPMFYCKEIISSNSNDKILDNKCIICENIDSTLLNFITPTDDPVNIEDIGFTSGFTKTGGVYSGNTLKIYNPLFIFFNKKNRRLLENVKVTVNLRDNSNNIYFDEGYSDSDGLVYLPNLKVTGINLTKGVITIEYDGVTKIVWEEN